MGACGGKQTVEPWLWSSKEAAKFLGVTRRKLAKWEQAGVVPAACVLRIPGSQVKYWVARLKAWAAGRA